MANGIHTHAASRRFRIGLNVVLAVAALIAIVLMVNYIAARHYRRLTWSLKAQAPFSPLTRQVLASITNQVKVIVYYERDEPLYDSVWNLLKEYKFANPHIVLENVDLDRDLADAVLVRSRYQLDGAGMKNMVIFDCNGRWRIVDQKQLSELDLSGLASGTSREVKRTHFRGEVEFTSALLSVTSARTLKAYFLQGHGEHRFDSDERLTGYSRFAGVLRENNVQFDRLSLLGTNEVPADCNVLIVARPRDLMPPEELEKIDRYLKQGGRMLALFNYETLNRSTGLESFLAGWGVAVGNNIVLDPDFRISNDDVVVAHYADHPLMKPFVHSQLYLLLPRAISASPASAGSAEAPPVKVLATTSAKGHVYSDIRIERGEPARYERPNDYIGYVPLMVAVEKGTIRGVSAERGSTRIVVVGDSIFLGNESIVKTANRDFASHALNWLLARHELMVGLAPQPITEYRINLTEKQMRSLRWFFLLGLPGGVLVAGFFVWLRRRS